MGEAIHVKCLECKKDYGIRLTGQGIQTVHNFLPGYCSTCRIVITSKAENPVCAKCKGPVTLCGRFVIETKKEWIENHSIYKYSIDWDLLKNNNPPASLTNPEQLSQLTTFNTFLERDIKRLENYYLSFEIDFKTKYDCKHCNTNNVQIGFGGMDWD